MPFIEFEVKEHRGTGHEKITRRVGSPCMLTMFLGVMTSQIFLTSETYITDRTIAAML